MGFQDSTSGGSEGFQIPWMSPRARPEPAEVPLDVKLGKAQPSLSSWSIQGSATAQGGGAVIGGGLAGGPVPGGGESWLPQHRGMIGGGGMRGGYG